MKKSMLSILALSAIMTLTGCGSDVVAEAAYPNLKFEAESVEVSSKSEFLFRGETHQIETLITPLKAYDAELVYTSSNTDVAIVSSTGLVTGVNPGTATIRVSSKNNPDIYSEMKIYSLEKKGPEYLSTPVMRMEQYAKRNVTAPRKILSEAYVVYKMTIDGVVDNESRIRQRIMMDKDNALMETDSVYLEQKIAGSKFMRSTSGYKVLTDENYHSWIFHKNDSVANRLNVRTEYFVGTETTRDLAVYAIMDSLFNAGKDMVENRIEDALGKDWYGYPSMRQCGGYTSDMTDKLFLRLRQDVNREATALTENNLGIPAGTEYREVGDFDVYFERGNVKSYRQHFVNYYEYKGKNYIYEIDQHYTFRRDDEFEVTMPDFNAYTQVYSINDL